MMRIGIYGGAFNPPHNGHINAVSEAMKGLELDEVLIIPTRISPHKMLAEGSPSPEERLKMVQIAFKDMEHVSVSDVEIKRKGASYTADTLEELREIYPEAEFWLITGADMFLSIQSWVRPEEIFSMCGICALSRENGEQDELIRHAEFLTERFGAECIILDNNIIEVSSTEVRSAIAQGRADGYMPAGLLEYIMAKGFYNGCC